MSSWSGRRRARSLEKIVLQYHTEKLNKTPSSDHLRKRVRQDEGGNFSRRYSADLLKVRTPPKERTVESSRKRWSTDSRRTRRTRSRSSLRPRDSSRSPRRHSLKMRDRRDRVKGKDRGRGRDRDRNRTSDLSGENYYSESFDLEEITPVLVTKIGGSPNKSKYSQKSYSSLDRRKGSRRSNSSDRHRLSKQVNLLLRHDKSRSGSLSPDPRTSSGGKRHSRRRNALRRYKTERARPRSRSPLKELSQRPRSLEKRMSAKRASLRSIRSLKKRHSSTVKSEDSVSHSSSRREKGRDREREREREKEHERERERERERNRERERERERQKEKEREKEREREREREEDSDGMFIPLRGSRIGSRYRLLRTLGEGTFGRVVECTDSRRNDEIRAVKVVRAVPRYVEEAETEADILDMIQHSYESCFDDPRESRIVRIFDHFSWRNHYCIVFEKLGMSLYDYVCKTDYEGLSLPQIRSIARDILEGLEFLHEVCTTVHTDLKLENVMFENIHEIEDASVKNPNFRVKLIDFGGATNVKIHPDTHKPTKLSTSVINTRQYRSPEVILRTGWEFKSDMWSLGCILAELLFGELLFQTHDDLEHLALIERVVGSIPIEMRQRAKPDVFDSHDVLKWPPSRRSSRYSSKSVRFVERQRSLLDLLASYTRKNEPRSSLAFRTFEHDMESFSVLLIKCLEVDPRKRISAHEGLECRFFIPM